MHILFVLPLAVGVIAGASSALAQNQPADRGELLFDIGGCTNCHTTREGPALAGGDPIVSPFGTFYPPNITPDAATGIGGWSDADFIKAMREGISPEGDPYYPAFPFTSYTHMSDADLIALKGYLDTIEPVEASSPDHELKMPVWPYLDIPLDLRVALWGWRWLFFEPERFEPVADRDEVWNRGAYLTLGPGHCAECHTPRNLFGALDHARDWSGNPDGAEGENVPAITADAAGIGDWSEGDLSLFLQLGMLPDGDFAGSGMAKIINNGTSKLPDEDRNAIITFLKNLP
ncbi:MAG: cytochrome c [Geminicoccaceae bacterium]|nr:cytochrome c [Geminicoccaceae bacterium]